MRILAGGQKGGTGKSMLAQSLATIFAAKGYDVHLVDADPMQGTTSNWHARREELGDKVPKIESTAKSGNIRKTINDLNERYDVIIIDCPGADSQEFRSGLACADVLVTPIRPSIADVETMSKVQMLVEQYKEELNPNLKAVAVFNQVHTNPNVKSLQEMRLALETEIPDLLILDSSLCYRKDFADSALAGVSAYEFDQKGKAAAELIALFEECDFDSIPKRG